MLYFLERALPAVRSAQEGSFGLIKGIPSTRRALMGMPSWRNFTGMLLKWAWLAWYRLSYVENSPPLRRSVRLQLFRGSLYPVLWCGKGRASSSLFSTIGFFMHMVAEKSPRTPRVSTHAPDPKVTPPPGQKGGGFSAPLGRPHGARPRSHAPLLSEPQRGSRPSHT